MKVSTGILFLLFIMFRQTAICQQADLNPQEWAKKLADPADSTNHAYNSLAATMLKMNSVTTFNFLDKIKSEPAAKGPYFLDGIILLGQENSWDLILLIRLILFSHPIIKKPLKKKFSTY